MSLIHAGYSFPGSTGDLKLSMPDLQVVRRQFFGVKGTAELRGSRGGRQILVPEYWFFNSYGTVSSLLTALNTLDSKVGNHGTLTEGGNVSRTFQNVTFDGFEVNEGPLQAIGATFTGWYVIGTLHFFQLMV